MPHLVTGHHSCTNLVLSPPTPRADAPPALKGHTRTGGDDPGPWAPADRDLRSPLPRQALHKGPLSRCVPDSDSRKVPGEKSKAEAKSASLGHPGGQGEKLKWWLWAPSVSVPRLVSRTRRAGSLGNRQGSAFKERVGVFLSQAQKQGATGKGSAHGAATRQVCKSQAPSIPAHGGQGLPRPCLALCSSRSSPRKPVRDWAFSATPPVRHRRVPSAARAQPDWRLGCTDLVHSFLSNNQDPQDLKSSP